MSMAARVGGGLFAAHADRPARLAGRQGHRAPPPRPPVRPLLRRATRRSCSRRAWAWPSLPPTALTAEALIQKAELAAAEAVENGGAIRFYGQSSRRVTERSRAITRLLANALGRGEFQVHYQPLVEGPDGADLRRGSAPALGVAGAGRDRPFGVRPPGRRARPHGADRKLGPAHGLPAGAVLDGRGPAHHAHRRQRLALPAASGATSPRSCASAWRRRASSRCSWSWS